MRRVIRKSSQRKRPILKRKLAHDIPLLKYESDTG